jgi:hypothetical protein
LFIRRYTPPVQGRGGFSHLLSPVALDPQAWHWKIEDHWNIFSTVAMGTKSRPGTFGNSRKPYFL